MITTRWLGRVDYADALGLEPANLELRSRMLDIYLRMGHVAAGLETARVGSVPAVICWPE